jgi:hypothetical protein
MQCGEPTKDAKKEQSRESDRAARQPSKPIERATKPPGLHGVCANGVQWRASTYHDSKTHHLSTSHQNPVVRRRSEPAALPLSQHKASKISPKKRKKTQTFHFCRRFFLSPLQRRSDKKGELDPTRILNMNTSTK